MADEFDDSTGGPAEPVADPIGDALTAARSALSAVIDEPAWTLTDEQVQTRFASALALRATAEELSARLLRSISDRDVPRFAGAASANAWLMSKHGLSAGDARRLGAEAKAHPGDADGITRHDRLAVTRTAWASGEVSAERVVQIAVNIDKLDPAVPQESIDEVQRDLLDHSKQLTYRQFTHLCRHMVEVVDPDTAEELLEKELRAEEERALQQTAVSFHRVGDGTTRFSGRLPDVQADMFKAALEAHASPRHCPTGGEAADERAGWTYPQRLGRALVELLEHLPTDKLPQHGVANASVVVTMTLNELLGKLGEATLETGSSVSAGQARRLACNANLIPAVLDGDSGVLDLGISQRLYTKSQRIALSLRDGGCIFPGCERPPTWTEAHHIIPWSRSGPTDLDNGCLLCPYHHHLIHGGEWQVVMAADGIPQIVPPTRIDPERKPIRHERLKPRRC